MKGVKGKFLKKLKSIKPILKQDLILQIKASDGYVHFLPKIPSFNLHSPFVSRENKPEKVVQSCEKMQDEPEVIDVAELMKDLEEEDDYNDNKENIGPCSQKPQQHHKGVLQNGNRAKTDSKQRGVLEEKKSSPENADNNNNRNSNRKIPLLDTDVPSFRRPDLNSGSLFDPNLLAAFEQAVKEHSRITEEQRRSRVEEESSQKVEDDDPDPLMFFEEKCPPGGDGMVIFYTTTLRGILKTFEDCNKIRFLLQSFKVLYFERDISMHKEFRDELWSSLEGKLVPPRLFVKGRYIGGAEEVLSLHEQGKLRKIFEGVPMDYSNGPCDACGGIRFVLCFKCNGSHKVMAENGESNQCLQCNENGLILCPYCC
ncbi:hypothetical protein AAZX31_10G184700 [Glycine max]|uniref:Glutaredoxin domain-containing protein n=2 Tax=Glycine subgen. Soja TaxID=1462606 RepID=I1LCK1_SOYBN|nr:uncharacterized protein At5g39865 [Glycine max]XP_028183755.1 uncharacterized protein At5g39865-like [Glycine soja]KAG4983817.1 hypothetical protein JHK87_028566 [Glycine soja]KAG5004635.1 hypothetical protein JHK86_028774 [Glycine max]KAG5127819.1 hypothetical protein JHK82_028654 [Glycine max]KAH1139076.1 hypothetical protein GYH30_028503 [Glycine max]KHN37903.1 Hypothetical protein glysoja_017027 [Glycine soja]|eukprot:XP_006589342.1 uncharacterized protein At5g39865 [Glycine max]